MAIINRDGDASETKEWLSWTSQQGGGTSGGTFGNGYVPTGATLYLMGPMPYPFTIQSIRALSPNGGSGAIQLAFLIGRPAVGGMTLINIGLSNLVVTNGASFAGTGFSGTFATTGYSGLANQGSTLLNGQAGDVLMAVTQGANTASNLLLIQMVWKKTQDIVSHNGINS
jgi:hypothetical protein